MICSCEEAGSPVVSGCGGHGHCVERTVVIAEHLSSQSRPVTTTITTTITTTTTQPRAGIAGVADRGTHTN